MTISTINNIIQSFEHSVSKYRNYEPKNTAFLNTDMMKQKTTIWWVGVDAFLEEFAGWFAWAEK